jgi:hypothetical protein
MYLVGTSVRRKSESVNSGRFSTQDNLRQSYLQAIEGLQCYLQAPAQVSNIPREFDIETRVESTQWITEHVKRVQGRQSVAMHNAVEEQGVAIHVSTRCMSHTP